MYDLLLYNSYYQHFRRDTEYSLDKELNVESNDIQTSDEESNVAHKTSGKKIDFERLELLLLQTLEMVMIYDDDAELDILENCLSIVDDIKGELVFLRAKIYKEIFRRKFASII